MSVDVRPIQAIRPLGANLNDLFASGDLCPIGEDVELFTDDFSTYNVGSQPGNPPWSPFKNANIIITKQLVGATPVVQLQTNATPATNTGGGLAWNQGYPGFNTTQCGVYISCKIIARQMQFSDGLVAGLVIGMMDTNTTTKLMWHFINQSNPANAAVGTDVNLYGAANNLIDSAAIRPVDGDVCKFRLTRTGAYGWRIEAEINGVVQGSSNSSLVQLTNANPKSLGFFCSIDVSGAPTTDFWKLADIRMGVS